jgi:hypothetical protein
MKGSNFQNNMPFSVTIRQLARDICFECRIKKNIKKQPASGCFFIHNPKTVFTVSGFYRHTDPLIHPHPAFSAFPLALSAIQTATPLDSTMDEVVDAVNLSTVNF